MTEKGHAMDNQKASNPSPMPEIRKTGDAEFTIDVTNCHGVGMERGDLFVSNPYAAPGQPAATALGSTRGMVGRAIEEALVQAIL